MGYVGLFRYQFSSLVISFSELMGVVAGLYCYAELRYLVVARLCDLSTLTSLSILILLVYHLAILFGASVCS